MEEIEMHLDEANDLMNRSIEHTVTEFGKIRAGKASTTMLDGILVDYYGAATPLNQVAAVNTPDARSILIKPFEKKSLFDIEKAIQNSDIGLNPQNDGDTIRLNIPPLTEERRRNLMKQVKHEAEQGKVSIRNVRKEINDGLRKLQKDGAPEDDVRRAEDKVQELTNKFTAKIDELTEKKEKEVMTV